MKIEENVSLKNYTTFKIGGPARFFAKIFSIEELKEAIGWAKEKKRTVLHFGRRKQCSFFGQWI